MKNSPLVVQVETKYWVNHFNPADKLGRFHGLKRSKIPIHIHTHTVSSRISDVGIWIDNWNDVQRIAF